MRCSLSSLTKLSILTNFQVLYVLSSTLIGQSRAHFHRETVWALIYNCFKRIEGNKVDWIFRRNPQNRRTICFLSIKSIEFVPYIFSFRISTQFPCLWSSFASNFTVLQSMFSEFQKFLLCHACASYFTYRIHQCSYYTYSFLWRQCNCPELPNLVLSSPKRFLSGTCIYDCNSLSHRSFQTFLQNFQRFQLLACWRHAYFLRELHIFSHRTQSTTTVDSLE